jgi:tetratricopeptide (TPR) repeat protein
MRAFSFLFTFMLVGATFLLSAPLAGADSSADLKSAVALFESRQYPDARVALEKIVAAEPNNATACHYLGRVLIARNDQTAFAEGLKWLARAAELDPGNAIFLGIYGGASLQHAGRTSSFSAATKGRDAMEKAIAIDPGYLDAREGLFQFYLRAPWPLGSAAKAAAQLEGIRQHDPDRATALEISSKAAAKDYPAAFRLCDAALEKNPDNYIVLYQCGRTAAISGSELERGLTCLQRCLGLEPPTPASPTHTHVWHRIGTIQEKLGRVDDARAAYQAALRLDQGNRPASDALARLK